MDNGERGELRASDGPTVFDRATVDLYIGILRDAAGGKDVTGAAQRLAAAFEAQLDRLAARAEREGGAGIAALSLAKRVVFEVLYHLVKTIDVGDAARDAVGRLLGRSSLFAPIPHARYRITQDWFSHNIPSWEAVVAPLRGKPDVRCLEIGSFEGLSACWLLENVLTHETSRIVCVDPFDGPGQMQAERHFDHNVRQTGAGHKVTKLKGCSRQALPLLAGSLFDVVYVDGSHHPVDTLQDALSIWPLLRRGGVAIFDDYSIGGSYPKELAGSIDPKPGVDAFLRFVQGEHEIVSQGYQMIVRKA